MKFENFERERLSPIIADIEDYSLMSNEEKYFVNGAIRYLKPQKILEVGVYFGGGSAVILNAISDIDGAVLHSVDYREAQKGKATGFVVDEFFPKLNHKWRAYKGGDVSRFIEDIGSEIDLLVLDTAHIHPWETLNFLCVLPFMKVGCSWCILHDIFLHYDPWNRDRLACRYLWSCAVSEDKISPSSKLFANIGAFRITNDTKRYVDNLFESLLIPWGVEIPQDDLDSIGRVIREHYPAQCYDFFARAIEVQRFMFAQPAEKLERVTDERLGEVLDLNSPIVIYGAGDDGLRLAKFFEGRGIKVAAFCERERRCESLNGLPVIKYSDMPERLRDCNFIVSVHGHEREEILAMSEGRFGRVVSLRALGMTYGKQEERLYIKK